MNKVWCGPPPESRVRVPIKLLTPMSAITPTQFSRRAYVLFAVMLAVALVIILRLGYWQIVQYPALSAAVATNRERDIKEPARRGDILTADGVLLATDIYFYEITAHPPLINDPKEQAQLLAPILNMSETKLVEMLSDKSQTTVMLTKTAPATAGRQLTALRNKRKINAIEFYEKPSRQYPNLTLAAQVVGFVSGDRKGAYGVEQYNNELLTGRDGVIHAEADALGDEILPFDFPKGSPAVDGDTLVLTLNSALQNIAERELKRGVQEFGAKSGQILILEPATGKILALAGYPSPDLNAYATTDMSAYVNPFVSMPYEPGSVFKAITLAAGLDSEKIAPNTILNDTGSVTIGGRTIYNSDRQGYGNVDLVKAMAKSLNVIAAKIALATGPKSFYQYLHDFGFGVNTGVELAGEIPGTVKNPGDGVWYESDLGTNSFGQGIAVTPLQMANALAVIANGGNLMRPYIVDRVIRANGTVEQRSPSVVRRVLKPETAKQVTDILSRSILTESTNRARLDGYTIAGKTGTAQIPIPGGYDPKWTIASFGGYFPADNPQYVILVKIDSPKKSPWGSQVASPIFAEVAKGIAQLTGLPPDDVRKAMSK